MRHTTDGVLIPPDSIVNRVAAGTEPQPVKSESQIARSEPVKLHAVPSRNMLAQWPAPALSPWAPGEMRDGPERAQLERRIGGDPARHVAALAGPGPASGAENRGQEGSPIHRRGAPPEDVPGFAVTVKKILGAGDAFGAGFLYGYVKGWELGKAARLGQRVLLLDDSGNWRGAGTAWAMAEQGHAVTLLTPDSMVGREIIRTGSEFPMRRRVRGLGVEFTAAA